ncbi:MAG: ribonuclease H-like domain-containing protein [bacterium]|nr:ribonuclease H-like domain-containing protein [bacterium]
MKPDKGGKSQFARKLARLRREGNTASTRGFGDGAVLGSDESSRPRAIPTTKSMPIWVRKRLEASRRGGTPGSTPPVSSVPRLNGRPDELQCAPDGAYWFRRRLYPVDYVHGEWALGRALGADNKNFELLSGDKGLRSLNSTKAVYLDTETTGLSGGAGVFVYMVGLASFTEKGLEVWQGFMDGPEQEAALLREVAHRISSSGGVVSFFGKSFDRHRLQDKMSVHGIESPFVDLPHLDLYHPLRRLHRGVYANSRLQTMERVLCGLHRSDDLPGSLAPEAWFDYLGKRAHRLEGVFRHNCDDVLSLVTLLAWLSEVDSREFLGQSVREEAARELALCEALVGRKDFELALDRLQSFLDRFGLDPDPLGNGELSTPEASSLWLLQAEALRRLRRGGDALASLQPLLRGRVPDVHRVRARALASKILERELRDHGGAIQMCSLALEDFAKLRTFGGRLALERDVNKRACRLAEKQRKATLS